MEWAKESVIGFIELYKGKEILWDPKHPMHFNKIKKQNAWEEMGNFENVLHANVRIATCQET
jgi:hypothetical protein